MGTEDGVEAGERKEARIDASRSSREGSPLRDLFNLVLQNMFNRTPNESGNSKHCSGTLLRRRFAMVKDQLVLVIFGSSQNRENVSVKNSFFDAFINVFR